jgi:hypothetical protein
MVIPKASELRMVQSGAFASGEVDAHAEDIIDGAGHPAAAVGEREIELAVRRTGCVRVAVDGSVDGRVFTNDRDGPGSKHGPAAGREVPLVRTLRVDDVG